jgi:hypothetical protein
LILFAIAVVSTAEEFGLISLLLILLTAGVGCMRGALGTPLLLKAADGTEQIRREGSYAVTAALAVCPPLVGGMWLLLKGRELGTPIILVAIATPVVMVQDVLRYVVISEGRPHVAAIWDGFWLLGSVGLLVSTWAGPGSSMPTSLSRAGPCWRPLHSSVSPSTLLRRFRGLFRWLATGWQHRFRYGIHAGLEQGVWRGLTKVAVAASTATVIAGLVFRLLPDSVGKLLLGNTFGLTRRRFGRGRLGSWPDSPVVGRHDVNWTRRTRRDSG